MLMLLFGCGTKKATPLDGEPKSAQMKAICELAVMDCYYHNVAKFYQENAEKGFLWFGGKDKHFWVEYSGTATLGIDASLVSIEVSDTVVSITIPEAKVLGCKVDSASLSKESFIVAKDSADITAEDEIMAFSEAQASLEQTAANDTFLLSSAQQRAQLLLEEYITNIGNVVDKQYTINWIYLDAQGNPLPA